ncbi:hypothetical protein QJ857_gp0235 [Tupanvirus soda lake]|uniref:FNIP repeat-containing protein n=2 Tax=Tupanvirus TaxID=2094720 RepID=A0A6N1NPJ0_9VIRU|nr:hypothetical protein QJ857_gp0235 [Tupanvirus soda lake]QKU35790.1 hypothetical protein [Tupanvirus soda lake]
MDIVIGETNLESEFASDSILIIPNEIIMHLCSFINRDRDTNNFLSTCWRFYDLKSEILFKKRVELVDIWNLPYFDQFTNVVAEGEDLKHINQVRRQTKEKSARHSNRKPVKTKPLNSPLPINLEKLELVKFQGYLGTWTRGILNLRCLILHKGCKITVKPGCLPSTLTHLTWEVNQPLKLGVLPEGLQVLKVDYYCYNSMALPSTLKSLAIGRGFNYMNHIGVIPPDMLPEGLEVLHLNSPIRLNVSHLPKSLTKLIAGPYYDGYHPDLPSTVQMIILPMSKGKRRRF